MLKKPAFITIQETSGIDIKGIALSILEEFSNIDMFVIEDKSSYFVLKFIYDDYTEVQEIVAAISYILIQEHVYEYTTTINCDE